MTTKAKPAAPPTVPKRVKRDPDPVPKLPMRPAPTKRAALFIPRTPK
jgi:hypothetical protein